MFRIRMLSILFSVLLNFYISHGSSRNLLKEELNCGITQFNETHDEHHRIEHGIKVPLGKWPWLAAIVKRDNYTKPQWCSATVISPQYILAAGHCVDKHYINDSRKLQVVAGALDITSKEAKRIDIESYEVHPDYVLMQEGTKLKQLDNDIAIFKLSERLQFSDRIQPICLARSFQEVPDWRNESAVIAGWGEKAYGERTNVLLEGRVHFNRIAVCKIDYNVTHGIPLKADIHVCAIGEHQKIMGGDSGGPLFVQLELVDSQTGKKRYMQVGITSFFGEPYPGVFARVTAFCDFIERATKSEVKCLPK
ncbi:trypsin domain-containing protein [Ditylenchus destructor]|uniref:Trypsin domain-containing protein n=1 Tax=Ditylenchus destructor TaxID=166010 RepID=A0AAD4MX74_9BILA|nr:trypsin domain-containing protein [Ditylenchus destructor]